MDPLTVDLWSIALLIWLLVMVVVSARGRKPERYLCGFCGYTYVETESGNCPNCHGGEWP